MYGEVYLEHMYVVTSCVSLEKKAYLVKSKH